MAVLDIADAFVTHCGMNSASEGLYFGVPLILFPQTPEQDAVAKRAEELGAGLRLSSISEDDILKDIKRIIEDKSFKEAADKVSESF
jgi:UDP:flavonoid glycosyltransferase YjiC (YdhE family)